MPSKPFKPGIDATVDGSDFLTLVMKANYGHNGVSSVLARAGRMTRAGRTETAAARA
jgi:hypothetical protein